VFEFYAANSSSVMKDYFHYGADLVVDATGENMPATAPDAFISALEEPA
jgi:hypothetical protein